MKELYDKDNELAELRDRKKRMKEGRENLDIIRKREGKGVVPIGALDELQLDDIDQGFDGPENTNHKLNEDATAIYNEEELYIDE